MIYIIECFSACKVPEWEFSSTTHHNSTKFDGLWFDEQMAKWNLCTYCLLIEVDLDG